MQYLSSRFIVSIIGLVTYLFSTETNTVDYLPNHKTLDLHGALLAESLTEQDRKMIEKTSPRTFDRIEQNEPLTINDIIKLSQSGVAEDKIIEYLMKTKSTYNLSQTQVRRLEDAGVSHRIITVMRDTQYIKPT